MARPGYIALGVSVLASAAVAGLVHQASVRGADTTPAQVQPEPSSHPQPERVSLASPRAKHVTWLAASSGAVPEYNQVSLEQDIALLEHVIAGPGRVLFGGGAHAPIVQVLRAKPASVDPVIQGLGDLFAPRGGRGAEYRKPAIAVDGEATAARVLNSLDEARSHGEGPLLVFLGGHGYPGEQPRDNTIGFWAQSVVGAPKLAEHLQTPGRSVRLVSTACFSGGLAEFVFVDAREALGPYDPVHCGLFAAPWDLEASGCDPNPDRAAQDGYALHFFNALRRRDRHGGGLSDAAIDFDDDGAVSLAEAHAYVRIHAEGADVPTSTSERWLRSALATDAAPNDERLASLPEEQAVLTELGQRLTVETASTARERLTALEQQIQALQAEVQRAQEHEDDAYRQASAAVLGRWPVLDDPYHPDFGPTIEAHHTALAEVLARDPSMLALAEARRAVDGLHASIYAVRIEAAGYERWLRAHDNLTLAARLEALGGPGWRRYQALLACERWVPPLRLNP